MPGIGSITMSLVTSVVEFGSITTWLGQYRSSPADVGVERADYLAYRVRSWTLMCDDSGGRMVSSEVVYTLLYPGAMDEMDSACDDIYVSSIFLLVKV